MDSYQVRQVLQSSSSLIQPGQVELPKLEYDFLKAEISEGQYIDSALNGFGRCIYANGDFCIGWFKNDQAYGYVKAFYDGLDRCGLYEGIIDGVCELQNEKDIKAYNPKTSYIA